MYLYVHVVCLFYKNSAKEYHKDCGTLNCIGPAYQYLFRDFEFVEIR